LELCRRFDPWTHVIVGTRDCVPAGRALALLRPALEAHGVIIHEGHDVEVWWALQPESHRPKPPSPPPEPTHAERVATLRAELADLHSKLVRKSPPGGE
jgi:hypothetical protein